MQSETVMKRLARRAQVEMLGWHDDERREIVQCNRCAKVRPAKSLVMVTVAGNPQLLCRYCARLVLKGE